MDLIAYCQIDDLAELAKSNGIEVPRLRGYRLMKDEAPFSRDEVREICKYSEIHIVENLCESEPFWNPNSHSFLLCKKTDDLKNFYLNQIRTGNIFLSNGIGFTDGREKY